MVHTAGQENRQDHRVLAPYLGCEAGGSPGFAIVEASAADDPVRLREMRENHHPFVTEWRAVDNELDGIARASGLGMDD